MIIYNISVIVYNIIMIMIVMYDNKGMKYESIVQ